MASWRADPQFIYERYCWQSAHTFIQDHFDTRTLAAFESCAVPAMQCDVFRLCWLFEHGGAYVDADQGNRGRNDAFTDRTSRGHLFRSPRPLPSNAAAAGSPLFRDAQAGVITNSVMSFFSPDDPLVGMLLARVSANIERRIDMGIWHVTGPGVLCGLLAELGPKHELFENVRIHSSNELRRAFKFVKCDYKSSTKHWRNVNSVYRSVR